MKINRDISTIEEFKKINVWVAGSDRNSSFYHIPIEFLDPVRKIVIKACEGRLLGCRIRWRGPRKGDRYNTLKRFATHFDIYLEDKTPPIPQTVVVGGHLYQLVK